MQFADQKCKLLLRRRQNGWSIRALLIICQPLLWPCFCWFFQCITKTLSFNIYNKTSLLGALGAAAVAADSVKEQDALREKTALPERISFVSFSRPGNDFPYLLGKENKGYEKAGRWRNGQGWVEGMDKFCFRPSPKRK